MSIIIVITGPTATGKTAFSVALAQALGGLIISADSRLVYQGLNVGTAKPTLAEQGGVPHHMIDVTDPTDVYTVARYAEQATPILTHALQNTQQPVLVVGGTGLYLKALLQADFVPAVPPDLVFRAACQPTPTPELYQQLQQQDPCRAVQLYAEDRVRIIRALEIIAATGQPVPQGERPKQWPCPVVWLGLMDEDRDRHRATIAARVQTMVKDGWIEETRQLMQQHGPTAQALQVTHGYPEWMAYLQGHTTHAQAQESVTLQVQQYARRQRTWFKRNPAIHWFNAPQYATPQAWVKVVQPLLQR
jgi:tRNA dimethylallyltransferase